MAHDLDYTAPWPRSLLDSLVTFDHGSCVIDLLSPNHPVRVDLVPTPSPTNVGAALARSIETTGIPALPEEWSRLAVVTGIDRWFQLPFDELGSFDDVLPADLAYAHSLVGNTAQADFFYGVARDTLHGLLHKIPTWGPIFDEFARVYAAAPYGKPPAELHALIAPRATIADTESADDPRRRQTRTRAKGAAQSMPLPVRIVVDPRSVPARIIDRESAQATLDDDLTRIRVRAFPGIGASTPAAERLVARLFDEESALVSLSDLTLAGGHFVATLPARGRRHGITVEIRDFESVGGPYLSSDDAVLANQIEATQIAYSWHRMAGAATALQNAVEADFAHVSAMNAVDNYPALNVDTRLNALPLTRTGPLRPLLAELVTAARIDGNHA
ncbi:hypothetical protein GIY30_02255 [Gordonia sp. HNM0687]|uniref:Uncharacterized protein n=1 Tax=Gordonia mangrovi TaxID=2665643 RepID=A0A6L7GL25_9ACTN|nr:hypothetical protein [Gordonia mangrovi]MXP20193.1 hypothetical protein [Gordonia mangrovi]UVF79200.1 DUF2156 domain-containing protein [Gordonia mangrovi]